MRQSRIVEALAEARRELDLMHMSAALTLADVAGIVGHGNLAAGPLHSG
jgi:hypothetical protein